MGRVKRYAVKEMFYTVQGEGAQAGSAAVFIRLTGCNLWTGREADRPSAICDFCDTDFVGTDGVNGGRYTAGDLSERACDVADGHPVLCVVTGGEPLLQLDRPLVEALQAKGFTVAVETNGTIDLPDDRHGLDWVCCSPKDPDHLQLRAADELKVVVPAKVVPDDYAKRVKAKALYVQPMDGADNGIEYAVAWVKTHPRWKISTQCHKVWGIE
jgi:7-carboxy-7-deazaguanine synthase